MSGQQDINFSMIRNLQNNDENSRMTSDTEHIQRDEQFLHKKKEKKKEIMDKIKSPKQFDEDIEIKIKLFFGNLLKKKLNYKELNINKTEYFKQRIFRRSHLLSDNKKENYKPFAKEFEINEYN